MSELDDRISRNLAEIRERIARAAVRSGRSADAVRLVAVTKYAELDAVAALIAAGCTELGESRPQQVWERAATLANPAIHWHLIGHLQRNKVRRTLPVVSMIQSVDSLRLLAAIDEAAAELAAPVSVLLEVNISGEAAKHGFAPAEVERALPELGKFPRVAVGGLMCMAALDGGPDVARRDFAALRMLRDRLQRDCPPCVKLDALSMGMSGDFEIAIEEGATLVRVGSALFE